MQFSNSNGPLDANDGWRLEGTRVILNDGRVMGDFAATFKAFHILANAFYIPAFRHVTSYAPEDNREYVGNHFEFRNGKVFIDFWGSAQSGNLISNRKKASSLVTEIANIFGYQGFEIKDAKDGRAMLVTIDGLPFRLDDVGTGLAQTIIMVANATYAEPTLLLIDEPELNLHPSLQTKLMNLLGTIASFGVVFATHSLGLARSMGDQIYAITKQGRESVAVEYHDHPRLAEFLGELNFSGFRDIGYDKLLLVEQRTDIKTFLELLRVVDLDHRTLVLSLGGSDFINGECKDELCEVLSICPDVYSIIDSEKMTKDDPAILTRTAFKSLCQKLAVPCLMLERRAIENYFTDKAVSTAKGADYKALHPFQQLSELSPTWEKAENWRIARNMSKEELMGTDLGNFLEAMKVETKGKKLRSAAKV